MLEDNRNLPKSCSCDSNKTHAVKMIFYVGKIASGQKLADIMTRLADSEEFGTWHDIHNNYVAGTYLNDGYYVQLRLDSTITFQQ